MGYIIEYVVYDNKKLLHFGLNLEERCSLQLLTTLEIGQLSNKPLTYFARIYTIKCETKMKRTLLPNTMQITAQLKHSFPSIV